MIGIVAKLSTVKDRIRFGQENAWKVGSKTLYERLNSSALAGRMRSEMRSQKHEPPEE
jgi:hypothetical protein